VLDLSGQRAAATAAIGVGIVFMLLAALAGFADYIDLEGKSRRFGTVHSSLMLVALVLYLVSFVMRLGAVPSPAEVWLSVIGFLIVITSAYVGGELVYNLGTQVDRHAWRGGGTKWIALDVTDIPSDKPVKAKAGAQTLVVVRRGTGLNALHDVCAHQGCSLSDGKIVGETIPVSWPGISGALHTDDRVYLADGSIQLRVVAPLDGSVDTEVEGGGALASHQGLNLPGADTGLPSVDSDDLEWIDFAVEHGIDLLAVSFVREASDLKPVIERLDSLDSDIPLIAKIEKPEAAEHAEEIIDAAGAGIMVARGDLGIELPLSRVPVLQKRLIRAAGLRSKASITATQMLASMVTSRRPTRAPVASRATRAGSVSAARWSASDTAPGCQGRSVIASICRSWSRGNRPASCSARMARPNHCHSVSERSSTSCASLDNREPPPWRGPL